MNESSGSRLEESWYVFAPADEIPKAIAETLGVDLSRKYLRGFGRFFHSGCGRSQAIAQAPRPDKADCA